MEKTAVDGVAVLSRLSGLPESEVKSAWQEVKANSARLDGCVGPHDFGPLVAQMGCKYTCAKCGGTIRSSDRYWYDRGLAHSDLRTSLTEAREAARVLMHAALTRASVVSLEQIQAAIDTVEKWEW